MIYVIKNPSNGLYKIGFTGDIKKRLSAFRTYIPDLIVIHTMDGGYDTERAMHDNFCNRQFNGEWFKLNDDDIDLIRRTTSEEFLINS